MNGMDRDVTRRKFLTLSGKATLGAVLTGALLTSCGGDQEAEGNGQISYWAGVDGAERQDYFRKNVVRAFEKANPNINLEVNFQTPDQLDRLVRTAIQGGEAPDIVPTPGPTYAIEYVQANLFKSLDEYAEQYGWREKMLGWAFELGRFEDSLYSIPVAFESMVLYYNRSLFEEKGWSPPANREELEALAEEAQGQGIVPFASGSGDYPAVTEWLMTAFWNHYSGPEALYQGLTGETPWTDPIFVEAVELLNQYMQRGWFGGSVQDFFSLGFDTVHAQLGDGKGAMNIEGTWFMQEVDDFFGNNAGNDNQWGWAPLPTLRDEVPSELYELGIGTTVSINGQTNNADNAAKYIDFLFSDPERAASWMDNIQGTLSPPLSLSESDFPADMDERRKKFIVELVDATSSGNFGYTTWTFWPPKSNVFIKESLQDVFTGDMSPAEYCAELNRIFQEELEEGAVPAIISPEDV